MTFRFYPCPCCGDHILVAEIVCGKGHRLMPSILVPAPAPKVRSWPCVYCRATIRLGDVYCPGCAQLVIEPPNAADPDKTRPPKAP